MVKERTKGGGGKEGASRRKQKKGSCRGLGHPRVCCGSYTTWIGENPPLWGLWMFVTLLGLPIYFITKFVFYEMWSLGQFPGEIPFQFTHMGWPNSHFYATWMPVLALVGASLMFISSFIIMIGGVHIPGLMWFLGTGGLVVNAAIDLRTGTGPSNFQMSLIEQSEWWQLSSWCVIIIGFIFSSATGVKPLPPRKHGCSEYWGRSEEVIAAIKPKSKGKVAKESGRFGQPFSCCDGCHGSCVTSWVGDNPGLYIFFAICFVAGSACYFLAKDFYAMWAAGQFDTSPSPSYGSFAFAHQSWPSNAYLYNPFIPIMLVIGSGLWFVAAFILLLGGMHIPGIFWVLGTGAILASHAVQCVSGVSGTGDLSNLRAAAWVNLAGWSSLGVGFIMCLFTGLQPAGPTAGCCQAAKERIVKSVPARRSLETFMKRKPLANQGEEESEEEEEEEEDASGGGQTM